MLKQLTTKKSCQLQNEYQREFLVNVIGSEQNITFSETFQKNFSRSFYDD